MTTLSSTIASAKTSDLVFSSKTNRLVTDSRQVAEYFGKRHNNVVRAITNIGSSHEFNVLNFERVHYRDTKGEIRQSYQMTKYGFMFLVMGFTGKRAAEIKERYINAFNEMEAQLSKKSTLEVKPDKLDPMALLNPLRELNSACRDIRGIYLEYVKDIDEDVRDEMIKQVHECTKSIDELTKITPHVTLPLFRPSR